jgi:hypothetical protein
MYVCSTSKHSYVRVCVRACVRYAAACAGRFPGLAAVVVSCFSHAPGERPTFGRVVDSLDAMLPEIVQDLQRGEGGGEEAGSLAAVFKGMFGG